MTGEAGRPFDPWVDPPEPPGARWERWLGGEVDDRSAAGVCGTGHNHGLPVPDADSLPDSISYAVEAVGAPPGERFTLRRELEQAERVVAAVHWWWLQPDAPRRARRMEAGQVCEIVREHTVWGARLSEAGVLCSEVDHLLGQVIERAPTERGLALRLIDRHGSDLAYTPATGGWSRWTGSRWRSDPDGGIARHLVGEIGAQLGDGEAWAARERAEEDAAALAALGDGEDESARAEAKRRADTAARRAKESAAFALRAQGALVLRHALEIAETRPGVRVEGEQWDEDATVLGTADGVIVLDADRGATGPRTPRRADRVTRSTRAGARAWADGVSEGGPWGEFVRRAFPDPAVRAYVQRLFGLSLLGDNRERLIVILLGSTSTGKSTLTRVVLHALGDYGGSMEWGLLRSKREEGPRPDMLAALPRRVIVATEAADRWRLDGEAIKRITGGDVVAARTLHSREIVERPPAFVPWVATNAAPQIVGVDAALWRRIAVVPMNERVEREDPGLGERLRADADAVLAWLLDGFDEYARHGLGEPPEACREAAEALRADLSLIDAWLADEAVAEPDAEVSMDDLAGSWRAWCKANDVPEVERLSAIALGKELSARNYSSTLRGGARTRYRVRLGLRLREPDEHGLRVVGP